MNLLAHAVLSPDNKKVRVGNVLADFISRGEREGLNSDIQRGIELHRIIDQYTDHHEVVARSKARLIGFQRFANPLIDVFYDHFLTTGWTLAEPVQNYVQELYRSIESEFDALPATCKDISQRMIEQDWMSRYGTIQGLEQNLSRMERRIHWGTGRTVDLVSSLKILEEQHEAFEKDFWEFWPQLVNKVRGQ